MSAAKQSCSPSSRSLRAFASVLVALTLSATQAAETGKKPATQAQTLDAERQVLFVAQPDGAVRVLNLRHTVGELGMLRAPQRRAVSELKLDASGRQLWVQGDDALYRYDARSLRLLQRQANGGSQLARALAPAATPRTKMLP